MKLQGPAITVIVALLTTLAVGSWIMGFWDAPPPTPPSTPNLIYHLPPETPHASAPPLLSTASSTLETLHTAPPPPSAPPTPPPPPGLAEQAAQEAADAQQQEIQSQTKAITNNLRQLASASQQYMLDKGVTQASYDDVVGTSTDSYIRSITPAAGENYQDMNISQTTTQISITTPDGRTIPYNL